MRYRVSGEPQGAYFGTVTGLSQSPHPSPLIDRPEIIAHRGTPRAHPENSLPGFRYALDEGADGIELDVHLTADGVVVVHHDPVVRGGGAPGAGHPIRIRDVPARELAAYPLAPGVPIPTLAEVLALVEDRAVVYVEVKAPEALDAALRCIEASEASCAVHGFDHRVALRTAHLADERPEANARMRVPTGILSASYLIEPVAALRAARARDYWQEWGMIDDDLVDRIHKAGGRVIAWTVDDVSDARRLADIGVDGVCTNVCGEMVRGFATRW